MDFLDFQMIDDKSQFAFEEFVKFCNIFLEKSKCSKGELAKKLGMEYTYFSKVYNGARPLPIYLLSKIKQLCESQKSPNPEQIAIQEQLPLNLTQVLQEVSKMQAIQDRDRKENRELLERVAVLEKDLERAKLDGEKKIYELESRCAATIRAEVERLTGRLAGGKKEANGG